MLLQQPSLHHSKLSISSTVSYSTTTLPWRTPNYTPRSRDLEYRILTITRSISHDHTYGAVNYENRPPSNWFEVYKRIWSMEDLGVGTVLDQCEIGGKQLAKWELTKIIKQLRKFQRFKQAIEVYEWMINRKKYSLSARDAGLQIDLVAKVHGIPAAEEYLENAPDFLKDKRIYGALLNIYVKHKNKEKAESLFREMQDKNYVSDNLSFNVMMTLYKNLKEYAKVEEMILEMSKKNIQLDLVSYCIWLSSLAHEGNVEKMEQAFEQMKLENVTADWTIYSSLASCYNNMGLKDKAEDCLKTIETSLARGAREPYHYLLSEYGKAGNKEAVLRVWETYKYNFYAISNLGYHAFMTSLIRLGDVETAVNAYDESMRNDRSSDPRLGNLIMACYAKEGKFDKLESFFNDTLDAGVEPNSSSWEILAEGHVGEKRISQALSCLKKAVAKIGEFKRWKPRAEVVSSFLRLCEEEGDIESKEDLEGLFRESGLLADKEYASLIGLSGQDTDTSGNGNVDDEESEVHVIWIALSALNVLCRPSS
ncbi:Pentatricopeptide repeat-containing protein At1g02150 [Linum grandiflorum]